jgi:hypothetical protein
MDIFQVVESAKKTVPFCAQKIFFAYKRSVVIDTTLKAATS